MHSLPALLPPTQGSHQRRDGRQPGDGQAVPAQRIRRGNATHRGTSFLPQEHSAGLILAVANLGEHLR